MRIIHKPISIKNFSAWWSDKITNGLNHPLKYFVAILPGVLTIFSLIADWVQVFGLGRKSWFGANGTVYFLITIVMVFGIINLILVFIAQQSHIRLDRVRQSYYVLHKDIIEVIRDYRAFKNIYEQKNEIVSSSKIKDTIITLLNNFNRNYMCDLYKPKVNATIKYYIAGDMHSIRVGDDAKNRNNNPEELSESHIFNLLNDRFARNQYIYIKNIEKPDPEERSMLGTLLNEVQRRAIMNRYKTFISLPIRSGTLKEDDASIKDWNERHNLGIIGFDLDKPYQFWSLPEHELECLACFADIMSELVEDLVDSKTVK